MTHKDIDLKVWHILNSEMLKTGWNDNVFYTLSDLFKFGESAEYLFYTGCYDCMGRRVYNKDILRNIK